MTPTKTMDGVIVVDKPEGWTSHDVVGKMRRIAGTKRIGHLGTLDPIATGVLPLVIGTATRLAQFYNAAEKVYEAVVRFGFATDTYDRAGVPTSEPVPVMLERERLEAELSRFVGRIQQTPPAVSAKKIGGVPSYKLARQKKPVDLAPVEIEIYEARLTGLEPDMASILVRCSTGTYVRSIAHDLGQALGCGAHLHALRRTRAGEFEISQARTIAALETLRAEDALPQVLIPSAELLPAFPIVRVDPLTAGQIRQGRDFHSSPFNVPRNAKYVKAIDEYGALVAIGELVAPNLYHPSVVMALV
jgi:tRNA pseudouridine55 synthase